ncbi:MAG: hypothetical protein K6B15_07070 [Parasporobacterium sp.]|nr:hypothetical protein [Parasporobacterium sp.]
MKQFGKQFIAIIVLAAVTIAIISFAGIAKTNNVESVSETNEKSTGRQTMVTVPETELKTEEVTEVYKSYVIYVIYAKDVVN